VAILAAFSDWSRVSSTVRSYTCAIATGKGVLRGGLEEAPGESVPTVPIAAPNFVPGLYELAFAGTL
jgi:hypothetical protein